MVILTISYLRQAIHGQVSIDRYGAAPNLKNGVDQVAFLATKKLAPV
jgi:hypothetical protein